MTKRFVKVARENDIPKRSQDIRSRGATLRLRGWTASSTRSKISARTTTVLSAGSVGGGEIECPRHGARSMSAPDRPRMPARAVGVYALKVGTARSGRGGAG